MANPDEPDTSMPHNWRLNGGKLFSPPRVKSEAETQRRSERFATKTVDKLVEYKAALFRAILKPLR